MSGFEADFPYNVSVESSEPVGVGHVLITSAGAFQQDLHRPLAASTMYSERHTSKSWLWMSPNISSFNTFFSVCATGYGGRAYVADAVTVFRTGQTQRVCSPSNTSAARADCHCLVLGGASDICKAGTCCWEDLQCRECSNFTPRKPFMGLTMLHSLLMTVGVALQLHVLVEDVPQYQHRYMLASCLSQLTGVGCSLPSALAGASGSYLRWHIIVGSACSGCSALFLAWRCFKHAGPRLSSRLQIGSILTLGFVAAGLGCVVCGREIRLWTCGLVGVIFGLAILHVVGMQKGDSRLRHEEPADRIEISQSGVQQVPVTPSEQAARNSSAIPLCPGDN